MKFSALAKGLLLAAASLLLVSSLSSCGNTMYGIGLDMERAGRRLQTNNDPNASPYGYGYQGYSQPTPSQNYGGGYQ